MFRPGQPIHDHDEDNLDRWPFAESLAEAILKYDETESIAIGLYGSWGAGKTSIINLLRESIAEKSQAMKARETPVIVEFKPWHYSDQNQLIAMFFKDLAAGVRHTLSSDKRKQIGELFESLSLFFFCMSAVPQVDPVTVGAAISVKTLGELFKKLMEYLRHNPIPDLNQMKSDLDRVLTELQQKIIIIIDDIDRLNNTEIRQIFQLVKSLADFKNTIYVLAFEKQRVMDALADDPKAPGQLYLEKIITVSFDIVSPSRKEIEKELRNRVKEIIADEWDEKVWARIYETQLRPFFSTLRDVSRFINSFGFGYRLVKDDVSFQDLATITAVQVHVPAVYSEIHRNKGLFAGEFPRLSRSITIGDENESLYRTELRQQYDRILEKSVKVPPLQLRGVLTEIFPKMDTAYSTSSIEWDRNADWRRDKRICSPEFFDRYFRLVLSADEFSQAEIDAILSRTSNTQELLGELERLKNESRLGEFLDTLQFLDRRNLSDNQISVIMSALLHIDDIFWTAQPGSDSWPVAGQISQIVSSYSRSLATLENRFQVLSESIRRSQTNKGIFVIVWTITDEYKVHARNRPASLRPRYQLELLMVDGSQLDELGALVSNIILERAADGRLLTELELPTLLSDWREWGSAQDFDRCLNFLTSEDHLVNFLASFNIHPDEALRVNATYRLEALEKFVNIGELLPRIRSIYQSASFVTLATEQQSAIRAIMKAHGAEPGT